MNLQQMNSILAPAGSNVQDEQNDDDPTISISPEPAARIEKVVGVSVEQPN
jgi:hypothetical protein